jgi:hypothetical protein
MAKGVRILHMGRTIPMAALLYLVIFFLFRKPSTFQLQQQQQNVALADYEPAQ